MRGRGWLRAAVLATAALAGSASEVPRTQGVDIAPRINYTLPTLSNSATAQTIAGSSVVNLDDGNNGSLQDNYFDNNTLLKTPVGIAIVASNDGGGGGQWEYALDYTGAGGTWIPLPTVSAGAALLLLDSTTAVRATASVTDHGGLRFVPNAAFTGTAWLQFRGWDQTVGTPGAQVGITGTAFSSELCTLTITITGTNTAPVLAPSTGNLALDPTVSGWTADPGTSVSTLLSRVKIGSAITDPDGPRTGIAVVGASNTSGTWQYDVGSGWQAMPAVSFTSGLRLISDSTTRVRFVPTTGFSGAIANALTFAAYDGSDGGLNGSTTGIAGNAYSTTTDVASIVVSTAGAVDFAGASPSFTGTLSVRGSTKYRALGLFTDEGAARFASAIGGLHGTARAFSWDSSTQSYVELPSAPSGGFRAANAVFVATKRDFAVDLSGRCHALPYDLVVHAGWNFIAIPALTDGTSTTPITSTPWANVDALDAAGVRITNSTVPSFNVALGQPWLWDGSSYVAATTLDSGLGYWVHNTTGADATLRVTGGVVTRGLRSDATVVADPPAPPSDSDEPSHHGCGSGGTLGIAAAGLLLALRLRRGR